MPDRQQMIEPLAHHFLQVVAGLAESGVALCDEVVLLVLQGASTAPIRGISVPPRL